MTENDSQLPKVFAALGVAAWRLPERAIRYMPAHRHVEGQLCGIDAGVAILETEAGSWLCPPGRCVWIPPNVEHGLRSCGEISGWMVRLSAEMCLCLPRQAGVLALRPLLREVVARVAEWAAEPVWSAERERLVRVLCDEIATAAEVPLHLPLPRDGALKRLAARLAEKSGEPEELAVLAREEGVSERTLFRKFQEETGMSPGQWRRQMQILRSLELLMDGRSVTEAAMEVGYGNVGAFTRAFRNILGTTPAAYAQARRGLTGR